MRIVANETQHYAIKRHALLIQLIKNSKEILQISIIISYTKLKGHNIVLINSQTLYPVQLSMQQKQVFFEQ